MPVAVVEQIALVLVSRLETLTVPGTENTTAIEVIRPLRIGQYTPEDWQVVLMQGDTGEVEDLMIPGNPPAVCYETIFNIRCHILPSEDDTDAKDSLINQFAADVRKVVCSPTATWHNFGGLSLDAIWQPPENINPDGSFDGVNVPLAVRYRTNEGDPYTVRA